MNGKFLTFPLSVLAMPLDEKEILQHIVSHSMERAGSSDSARQITDDQVLKYVTDHDIDDYSSREERHKTFIRGAIILNVRSKSCNATGNRCDAVEKFVRLHEHVHGTGPLVFIAAELLWSCNDDDQDLTYREFSTACAVNSVIGFKQSPAIIRRSLIIARQLGYKTPAVMDAEFKAKQLDSKMNGTGKPKLPKPLTTQQLRDTLDKLELRGLFRRCQPGRRTVYFSTTLDRDQLWNAVKEKVEKRGKIQMFRQLERDMFGKQTKNQSETNGEPLKDKGGKTGKKGTTKDGTNEPPIGSQLETAGETTSGTNDGTTKINASLIKAPLTNAFKEKREKDKASDKVLETGQETYSPEQVTEMFKRLREDLSKQ